MPDITMCSTDDCPRRKECYRHEAKPDSWQSYTDFYKHLGLDCDKFWEINKGAQG